MKRNDGWVRTVLFQMFLINLSLLLMNIDRNTLKLKKSKKIDSVTPSRGGNCLTVFCSLLVLV